MGKDIAIIGAGGFGREVAWLIERINQKCPTWNIVGFLDDDPDLHGMTLGGYPVLGGVDYLSGKDLWAVCAIGSARIRKTVIEKVESYKSVRFATLIDPSVIMSGRVSVGEGSILCSGSVITVDVKIGSHVIVNLDCTLGHDDIIGNYVTLYPSVNISGMVKIGDCTEVGTGTQIRQGLTIANNIITGAGAVIVKDIDRSGTYVGVPVTQIK